MREAFLAVPAWLSGGSDRDVVIGLGVRCVRNLAEGVFPWRASAAEAREVRDRLETALTACWPGQRAFVPDALDGDILSWCAELGWIEGGDAVDSGRSVHWLDGDGLTATLNDGDHLRLAAWSAGGDLEGPFGRLRAADTELETVLDWAANLERGYLCARAEDTGFGLSVAARVFLPGIMAAGMFERVAAGLNSSGVRAVPEAAGGADERETAVGLDGSETGGAAGAWLPFATLTARAPADAASEEEFLAGFADSLSRLIEGERRTRERLLAARRSAIEDAAYRAVALLTAARRLGAAETDRLVAAARAGTAYGVGPAAPSPELAYDRLDRARLVARPARLRCLAAGDGEAAGADGDDALDALRARLVRETVAHYDIG
jgi:protein arginine kinase